MGVARCCVWGNLDPIWMARYSSVTLPVQKRDYQLVRRLPCPDMAATQQEYGIGLPMGQEQEMLVQYLYYGLEEGGSLAGWASKQVATQIRMLAGRAVDRGLSLAGYRGRVGLGGENGVGYGFST